MTSIDNPILNSPYEQPDRHYVIGPQGPTGEVRDGRRPSESLIPIAVTKKGKAFEQEGFDFDLTHRVIFAQREAALWIIDTNYNEESFFVRHCYFTGGNDPYKRLKTALKSDIDEDAWASLYQTTSRPFAKPETGKIAIKVINDYGDEVMKVFEVV
ncbi:hypothetical protein [Myceligenerans indicum]|uniref:hypothetical protein n=1 Tax=Myceligenerans indicum TaxID=2593663 RepID=UPI001FD0CE33|nr:hypothetical protein [Myceligenerans indicum]